jgi:glycosyltransferase involved in cell wall biosynthesis
MTTRGVVYFTDSDAVGGAEQSLLLLMSRLDAARWSPTLLHYGGEGIGPMVRASANLNVPDTVVARLRGRRDPRAFARLVAVLRRHRPAVFHANLNSPDSCRHALLAAALARVPVIVATQHFGCVPTERRAFRHRIALAGVDRFIAVSHDSAARIRQALGGRASRVVVIHNGISVDRFEADARAATARPERGSATGTSSPVALTVGRLVEGKGHRFLLQAAVRIPELRLVIAGEGPERHTLETQAHALGIADRTQFAGWRDDIPTLLSACDVFVLPSLFEGHPLSALEAMAAGRPVVASDAGGTREAVSHGETGFLVPAADPVALADAIAAVVRHRPLAVRMGAAGRERVHHEFTAEMMVRRVTGLYDELLERSA